MGIGGIGKKVGYNEISYVLALVLFFSVASIILQPSYQDHVLPDVLVEFPIELCPIQEGVYYKNWTFYGSQPDRKIAVCDNTLVGLFSFMPNATEFAAVNNATGVTRNDAKKFHDWKYAAVPIPNSDIISVTEVNLTAHARNLGTNDNKLDFMLFTGTKSTNWLTLKTFYPVSTSPNYTPYQLEMKKNPTTIPPSDWTTANVKTWVSGGKTMAPGLNEQLKQNSGKINVGTYRVTVGINAYATLSFNTDRYASAVGDLVILTLDGPANLGSVPVNLHSRDANANLSVLLYETSTGSGIYTNEITLDVTGGPKQLAVSSNGDEISMSFLSLTVYADVLPAGVALSGFIGIPGPADLLVRWHQTREYSMTQGATIDVNNPPGVSPTATSVTVIAKSYSDNDRLVQLDSRSLTANRVGTSNTFTTSTLSFSSTPTNAANVLTIRLNGGPISAYYGTDFDNAQVYDDTVTVPFEGPAYVPDNTIRQNCSELGGDSDGDGYCNIEETTNLKVPLASGCILSGGVYDCTYIDNNDGPSGGVDGIPNGGPDGVPDYYWELPCSPSVGYGTNPRGDLVCPNVNKKDVYVYYNWMKFHKHSDLAWNHIVTSFANSGVPNVNGATPGIQLHVIPGVQMDHINYLFYADPNNVRPDPSYIELKNRYFLSPSELLLTPPAGSGIVDLTDYREKLTDAKRQVMKHMISGHDNGELNCSAGYSERPGDDFFTTMACTSFGVGTITQQERTIMHELGHALGLRHACDTGTNGAINGEPNCPSVMNYLYQFLKNGGGIAPVAGITPGATSPLDYSPYPYTAIRENALTDSFKVSHGANIANKRTMVVGGCTSCTSIPVAITPAYVDTNVAFDWNRNAAAGPSPYSFNVHYFATTAVPGLQDTSIRSSMGAIREWSALTYSHVLTAGFDLGVVNIQGKDDPFQGSSCGPLDPETLAFEVDAGDEQTVFEGEPYSFAGSIEDPHWTGDVHVTIDYNTPLPPTVGTPEVDETVGSGEFSFDDYPYDTIGDYTVTLAVDKDISQPSCDGGSPITYHISASDTTTVHVKPKGHIIINKVTDPIGDPQSFSFDASGGSYADFLADTTTPNDQKLVPGTYIVSENVPEGWDLTSSSCVSDKSGDTSTPAAIDLEGGETITCTFTNTKRGHIVVNKVTDPSGAATSFSFTTTGTEYAAGFSLTDAAAPYDQELKPGTYIVSETVPAGWRQTSATCTDDSNPLSIELSPGEIVTCTFVNANLVVVYQGPVVTANKFNERTLPVAWTVRVGIDGTIITTETPELYTLYNCPTPNAPNDECQRLPTGDGTYNLDNGQMTLSDSGVYQVQLNIEDYPNGTVRVIVVLDDGSEWRIDFTVKH